LATPPCGETPSGARNLPRFLCSHLAPGPVLVLGGSEVALEAAKRHDVTVVEWNPEQVVALDAAGAREVVRDEENGRLVLRPDAEDFREALRWVAELDPGERIRLAEGVDATAREFSMARSAAKQIALYETLANARRSPRKIDASPWASARTRLGEEWKILRNIARAAGLL